MSALNSFMDELCRTVFKISVSPRHHCDIKSADNSLNIETEVKGPPCSLAPTNLGSSLDSLFASPLPPTFKWSCTYQNLSNTELLQILSALHDQPGYDPEHRPTQWLPCGPSKLSLPPSPSRPLHDYAAIMIPNTSAWKTVACVPRETYLNILPTTLQTQCHSLCVSHP